MRTECEQNADCNRASTSACLLAVSTHLHTIASLIEFSFITFKCVTRAIRFELCADCRLTQHVCFSA
jgi:hypothetical protein